MKMLLMLLLLSCVAFGNNIYIHNADEFIEFSKNVSKDETNYYEGSTVLLSADITFTEELSQNFEPIQYFNGTFDGQGYTINNLAMNPSSQYVGLFGYSKGSTIRNIVLASSCSIANSGTYDTMSVGSIIGECGASERPFIVEGCVNMANVSFGDSRISCLYLGGIAGHLNALINEITIRNCANYGTLSYPDVVSTVYIGGIAGFSGSSLSSTSQINVLNCLNYGPIAKEDGSTSGALFVGGIIGYTSFTILVENCVSARKIDTSSGYVGKIVGSGSAFINVTHCFWTSDTGVSTSDIDESSFSNSGLTTLDSSFVNKMNEYATTNSWDRWLLNPSNATVTLMFNEGDGFPLESQLILLPGFSGDGGSSTSGWYKDEALTSLFTQNEVEGGITLYGKLYTPKTVFYTVTFDANGGEDLSFSTTRVYFGTVYGTLPTATRTGYTLGGWYLSKTGDYGKINSDTSVTIQEDTTIYAHWIPNNYIAFFGLGNGTVIEKVFEYNESIIPPANVERDGYTFSGWYLSKTGDYGKINSDTPVNIQEDTAIYAHWIPNNYTAFFDLGNGTVIEKVFEYNESIIPPANVERDGYTFSGWNNSCVVMPDHNITVNALWNEITSNTIEIVFGQKDLTEEDIRNIVKQYTDGDFTITKYENNVDEIRVIIKFKDDDQAKNFVETIKATEGINVVDNNGYFILWDERIHSFSASCYIYTRYFLLI